MDKLNKLYQIESALTTCSLGIPMGLRKESQLGTALSNVEELIELEIQEQVECGNSHIIPSYADGRYQEIEIEYNAMQQAINDEENSK
jgi:hypothetical protein